MHRIRRAEDMASDAKTRSNRAVDADTDATSKKSSLQDRIRELKNARAKSVLENRRAVYDEVAGFKTKHAEKKKLDKLEDDVAEEEGEAFIEKGKSKSNVSKLEYTAEEDEKWETKQGRINTHKELSDEHKGELHNYKQLAERTYSKNIRVIEQRGKKSLEKYQMEKSLYDKLKAQGLSPVEVRSRLTSSGNLDTYVKDLKSWEEDVFRKRRKVSDEGKDGAIHEKNRQFNSKLQRHYRQFKE
ncbi:hypothetical protein PMKS-002745 [Pichia membranifaciens]|uniref:Pre-mRNA-splicing factor SYF2 n=1 Tax=Pichia membranifaciens TaxID=4926 RepID=A0A1Q2YIR7_9ASCO|nr:hypothetical protein PMKS-002745 [Pichia membranifaciens]